MPETSVITPRHPSAENSNRYRIDFRCPPSMMSDGENGSNVLWAIFCRQRPSRSRERTLHIEPFTSTFTVAMRGYNGPCDLLAWTIPNAMVAYLIGPRAPTDGAIRDHMVQIGGYDGGE